MRIVLLIRALVRGGAERQLVTLAGGLATKGHEVHVLSFYADGGLLQDLLQSGAQVKTVGKHGRWDMAGFLVRLVRELRRIRPEVLYSSMPAANIVGCLAGRLAGRPRIVWRVASSEMDLARYDRFSALSYRIEAACSSMPEVIVANSAAGREAAVQRGFAPGKVRVVRNGVRTDVFQPHSDAGAALRRQWGLDDGSWIIGQVARSDPKKGYEDFLDAAALLCERRSDVRFLCVGVEPDDYAHRLGDRAVRNSIASRVTWRGMEDDMRSVYNAMDINTLASRFGEGCPNTIGEAMACGVPCVVTDVGDSGVVVGRTGEVVPPASPAELAAGWMSLLTKLEADPAAIKSAARTRIIEDFSVERYVEETEAILLGIQ